jgi:hypothetical protein
LDVTAGDDLLLSGDVSADSLDLEATNGSISQGADSSLTVVTGPSDLVAGTDITLDGPNDFNGVLNADANDITLNDINSLELGDVTADGVLAVTTGDDLVLSGDVSADSLDLEATNGSISQGADSSITVVTGPSDLVAGTDITLDGPNDFNGPVNADANDITLNDINSLELGDVTAGGNLDVTAGDDLLLSGNVSADSLDLEATNGSISQGADSSLTVVTGPSDLVAGTDITLDGPNDFNGPVNADANDITLNDINSLELGDVTAGGNLDVTAGDDLLLSGNVRADSLDLEATNGSITQGPDSTLTVVTGPSDLVAGTDITLDGPNDFNGPVNADANDITLNDINSLELGDVTAGGNLDVTAGDDLLLSGNVSADSLNLEATNGSITQGPDSSLTVVTGPSDLVAGTDITLPGENSLSGSVTATGQNITISAVSDLTIDATASADLTLTVAGNLAANIAVGGTSTLSTTGGGSLSVDGSTQNLIVRGSGETRLGQVDVEGDLDVESDGPLDDEQGLTGNAHVDKAIAVDPITVVTETVVQSQSVSTVAVSDGPSGSLSFTSMDSVDLGSNSFGFDLPIEESFVVTVIESEGLGIQLFTNAVTVAYEPSLNGGIAAASSFETVIVEVNETGAVIGQSSVNVENAFGEITVARGLGSAGEVDSIVAGTVLDSTTLTLTTDEGSQLVFDLSVTSEGLSITPGDGLAEAALATNRETLVALSLAKVLQDLQVSESSLRKIVIRRAVLNPLPVPGIASLY